MLCQNCSTRRRHEVEQLIAAVDDRRRVVILAMLDEGRCLQRFVQRQWLRRRLRMLAKSGVAECERLLCVSDVSKEDDPSVEGQRTIVIVVDELKPRLPRGTDLDALSTYVLAVLEGGVMLSRSYGSVEPFNLTVTQLRQHFHLLLDSTPKSTRITRRRKAKTRAKATKP